MSNDGIPVVQRRGVWAAGDDMLHVDQVENLSGFFATISSTISADVCLHVLLYDPSASVRSNSTARGRRNPEIGPEIELRL